MTTSTKIFGAIAAMAVSALFTPAYAAGPSGTLPTIYIDTENGRPVVEKEDKVPSTIWIDPCGTGIEALGSKESPVAFTLSGRGNYTWSGFDKKPYKLKFDSKTSVMGLPKNKNFAILAHPDDEMAFLRNTVGFELSRRVGLDWTPNQIPVEFVLNGEYRGLYFLTETIKVDTKRVNIAKQNDLETDPTAIAGGWLVEIDNYDTDPHVGINENGGYRAVFTYKAPEELSKPQEEWLTAQMQAIDNAIYTEDKSSTAWEDLIDIESAARFYVVQEIMDDCESYHGSCYLTHDLGDGAKWKFGPVWDFGNTYRRNDKKWIYQGGMFHQVWIGELAKFPRFREKVKEVWGELLDSGNIQLDNFIDSFTAQIKDAASCNAERWPQYGNSDIVSAASNFKRHFNNSVSWLGIQWEKRVEVPVEIYLRGEFNGWGIDTSFATTDQKTYTLPVESLSGEFKVASADWKTVDFGGDGVTPIRADVKYPLVEKGKNIVTDGEIGPCTIIFDKENKTLTLSTGSGVVSNFEKGDLRVEGRRVTATYPAIIYDARGIEIGRCDNSDFTLPAAGLYIITGNSESRKVIVK